MPNDGHIHADHAHRLDDPRRLQTQVSEHDLARLLALRGDEDLLDLGSGTGFYTDRMAALTTGTVYAVDFQPEMNGLYRRRGVPANVRLVLGDMTALPVGPSSASHSEAALRPASVDVVCTIATWHEVDGKADLPGLARVLRPGGRLVVIDWRRDAVSWETGPPRAIRVTRDELAQALAPYFAVTASEDLGDFIFAVVARLRDPSAGMSSV
jgi:SAM-dependent methyltransferase